MNREKAIPFVSFVVDDAGSARRLNEDMYAIVREAGEPVRGETYKYSSALVGWQCGFEPLFVAVHSYLDVELDNDRAEEMARDYLTERKWFTGEPRDADYIIR